MTQLPELTAASLTRYLELREEWLACKFADARYSVSSGFATEEEAQALQAVIVEQARELHRLRLVFLGIPIPSIKEWMLKVIQMTEADPGKWAGRRSQIVAMSFELPGQIQAGTPVDPVDRVTAQYREALAADPG